MRFFQDSRGVSVAGVTGPRMPAKFLHHNVVSAGSAQAAIPSFFFFSFLFMTTADSRSIVDSAEFLDSLSNGSLHLILLGHIGVNGNALRCE